jgi:nitrile hydratase accessory protein
MSTAVPTMPLTLEDLLAARGTTPREATFAAPWEARAFALAATLAERGAFGWEAFRERLIAAIAQADARGAASYYECWLAALEGILETTNFVGKDELERRAAEIAAHPPTPTRATATGPLKIA